MERFSHDLVIVGGGAAGLRAAIAAAEESPHLDIVIISKVYPMRSHTVSAEGGLAAVLRDYDTLDLHAFDTVKGSDFLADQDAVELFTREAPKEIIQLEHWGCPWSRDPDGRIAVRAFGGMSVKRTIFAADKVGFHLLHTLFQHSLKYDNIQRLDEWFVTSLVREGQRVIGATALDLRTGTMAGLTGKAFILTTGGAGRAFQFTTNGMIKTGDGMAMAYRAGAPLKDMEFVQFHPTALPGTGILITEASRGEGGYLRNADGDRFLKSYVPGKMELGPRDLLSRAIMTEIREGRGIEGPYGPHVHLDLTHLGRKVLSERLPMVTELAEKYVGINPEEESIPVRPGVHYMMGGVHTDATGQTSLAGLYAAGETACVSINGANRLGSNSLTECLVFGARAGLAAGRYARQASEVELPTEAVQAEEARLYDDLLGRERGGRGVAEIREELQTTMEDHVGISRDAASLSEATKVLARLKGSFEKVEVADKDRVFNTELTSVLELESMLTVAEAIVHSALRRTETRGAHFRTDFPERDDENFLAHTVVTQGETGPEIEYLPVTITRWKPEARVY
ncbi:MAG: FAD-binding protein [Candidatus Thermoplasmatota archaeon]|nr:FAD-binding protein [Candidatus Thermoplasmatota archaeon]